MAKRAIVVICDGLWRGGSPRPPAPNWKGFVNKAAIVNNIRGFFSP